MSNNFLNKILEKHQWLFDKNSPLILSPDSDGLLCGLVLTNLYGMRVQGFYDGKVLALHPSLTYEQCAFIDIEVNRNVLGSFGHHMLTFNNNFRSQYTQNYSFKNCLQPNEIRNLDANVDFQKKYPFGTIHLLLALVQARGDLPKDAFKSVVSPAPLLFTDGVLNNLYGYPENCIEWAEFIGIDQPGSFVGEQIFNSRGTLFNMRMMRDFFLSRDNLNPTHRYENGCVVEGGRKRKGDKLIISSKESDAVNLVPLEGRPEHFKLYSKEAIRIQEFLKLIGNQGIGFEYKEELWNFSEFKLKPLQKMSQDKLSGRTFVEVMRRNPFSLAITSGKEVEFTVEP
jgi:hypothetical protein